VLNTPSPPKRADSSDDADGNRRVGNIGVRPELSLAWRRLTRELRQNSIKLRVNEFRPKGTYHSGYRGEDYVNRISSKIWVGVQEMAQRRSLMSLRDFVGPCRKWTRRTPHTRDNDAAKRQLSGGKRTLPGWLFNDALASREPVGMVERKPKDESEH
jgi:hypothetical protein